MFVNHFKLSSLRYLRIYPWKKNHSHRSFVRIDIISTSRMGHRCKTNCGVLLRSNLIENKKSREIRKLWEFDCLTDILNFSVYTLTIISLLNIFCRCTSKDLMFQFILLIRFSKMSFYLVHSSNVMTMRDFCSNKRHTKSHSPRWKFLWWIRFYC